MNSPGRNPRSEEIQSPEDWLRIQQENALAEYECIIREERVYDRTLVYDEIPRRSSSPSPTVRRSQTRESLQVERFYEEQTRRRDRERGRPMVRESSRKIEYDESYDPTYRRGNASYFIGDSQDHRKERTSRSHAIVRHTEYYNDAGEDFTKPYRPATFTE